MLAVDERRHLEHGARVGETHGGAGLVAVKVLGPRASAVVRRAIDVLHVVLDHTPEGEGRWPTDDEWAQLLPPWFVTAGARPATTEQTERYLAWWRGLDPERRAAAGAVEVVDDLV